MCETGIKNLFCIIDDDKCKKVINFFTLLEKETKKETKWSYGFKPFYGHNIRKEPLLGKLSEDEKNELYNKKYLYSESLKENQKNCEQKEKMTKKSQNFLSGYCNIFK